MLPSGKTSQDLPKSPMFDTLTLSIFNTKLGDSPLSRRELSHVDIIIAKRKQAIQSEVECLEKQIEDLSKQKSILDRSNTYSELSAFNPELSFKSNTKKNSYSQIQGINNRQKSLADAESKTWQLDEEIAAIDRVIHTADEISQQLFDENSALRSENSVLEIVARPEVSQAIRELVDFQDQLKQLLGNELSSARKQIQTSESLQKVQSLQSDPETSCQQSKQKIKIVLGRNTITRPAEPIKNKHKFCCHM